MTITTFLTNPGDVPRVDGQLAVARAFGDRSLKNHLSSEPDVVVRKIDDETEFVILASDGLWKVGIDIVKVILEHKNLHISTLVLLISFLCSDKKFNARFQVMSNEEAVESIGQIKDARAAAKHLTEEALKRQSKDDISCIVVRFQ